MLDITLAPGGAKRVLVRLLSVDQNPDEAEGVIGDAITVPANGEIKVILRSAAKNIKQISVHGGPTPWDTNLGSDNGNAKIVSVAID